MFTNNAILKPLSELKTLNNFSVALSENSAKFDYALAQEVPQKLINDPELINTFSESKNSSLKRKDQLWLDDCFEFFLKIGNSSYLEFNFSPIGNWNVFEFSDYRENKHNYKSVELVSFQKNTRDDKLIYTYDLKGDFVNWPITCHGTAILYKEGEPNYFNELGTISPEPDFHLFRKDM